MKCCGQERTTAFCPDCGRELQQGSLQGLLRHVEGHLKTLNTTIDRYGTSAVGTEFAGDELVQRRRRSLERKIRCRDKWQRWATELRLLLDGEQEKDRAA